MYLFVILSIIFYFPVKVTHLRVLLSLCDCKAAKTRRCRGVSRTWLRNRSRTFSPTRPEIWLYDLLCVKFKHYDITVDCTGSALVQIVRLKYVQAYRKTGFSGHARAIFYVTRLHTVRNSTWCNLLCKGVVMVCCAWSPLCYFNWCELK